MSSVVEIDVGAACDQVRNSLGLLLADREDVKAFVRFLAGFGKVVVFGGYVRDAIHNSVHADKRQYRDLDLVVVGEFRSQRTAARNNFGGFRKLFADGLKIDYWPLASTYAFSKGLFKPSLSNLAKTTVFTINACVFDPAAPALYEHNAIHSILHRKISFNCTGYLDTFPEYQAFRAIDFSERLGYSMDQEVADFVGHTLAKTPMPDFIQSVRKHRDELSDSQLADTYRRYVYGSTAKNAPIFH